jgi:hypothetical protein
MLLNNPWLKPVVVFALCEHGDHPLACWPLFFYRFALSYGAPTVW